MQTRSLRLTAGRDAAAAEVGDRSSGGACDALFAAPLLEWMTAFLFRYFRFHISAWRHRCDSGGVHGRGGQRIVCWDFTKGSWRVVFCAAIKTCSTL